MSLRGHNQMIYPLTYVFLACMLFSIFTQLHFLALGLSFFDALYVVPVFQCFFVSVSTLGGAAYFSEFSSFLPLQMILFPIGILCTLSGVYILSSRSMKSKPRGQEATQLIDVKVEGIVEDGQDVGASTETAHINGAVAACAADLEVSNEGTNLKFF